MEKAVSLPILNFHAAGIDIGSRSHFVAVGQSDDEIREFGVSTEGHQQIIDYLKEYGVRTIAMESTGSYWQSLFNVLQEAGFEVLLVPGNQTKHLLKTDVKDARRIQKLHSLGLLSGSFLPDSQTLRIRTITRHRNSLVESCARYTNKIQKSLRLMNIRRDVCLRDVVGKSGRAIIEAVLDGERSPEKLSLLTDRRVKKPRKEILLNLEGQWNDELLFELRDSYELLLIHEQRILNCDEQIELILSEHVRQKEVEQTTVLAKKQTKGKHVCQVDLSKSCYEILGVDIFSIGGVGPGGTYFYERNGNEYLQV